MTAFKKMIDLNTKIEVYIVKKIASFIFKIDSDSRNMEIDLIEILL